MGAGISLNVVQVGVAGDAAAADDADSDLA